VRILKRWFKKLRAIVNRESRTKPIGKYLGWDRYSDGTLRKDGSRIVRRGRRWERTDPYDQYCLYPTLHAAIAGDIEKAPAPDQPSGCFHEYTNDVCVHCGQAAMFGGDNATS